MKVLVIIGHQQQGSFNHAIARTAIEELKAASHEVVYHDLYAERFDPILPAHEIPNDAEIDPVGGMWCRRRSCSLGQKERLEGDVGR